MIENIAAEREFLIEKMQYVKKTHILWAEKQRRLVEEGKPIVPFVGDEAHHKECVATYDRVISYLNKS